MPTKILEKYLKYLHVHVTIVVNVNFQFVKEIRLIVRELDTTAREVSLILQQIHQEDGLNESKLT